MPIIGSGLRQSTSLRIRAEVGLRPAEVSEMLFSYLPPSVTALIPDTIPTSGGKKVTLIGRSFGSSSQVARSDISSAKSVP
jgi:hypothetical protein